MFNFYVKYFINNMILFENILSWLVSRIFTFGNISRDTSLLLKLYIVEKDQSTLPDNKR